MESPLLLPPRFMGSVAYYSHIMHAPSVVIDSHTRFDKRQKATHRTAIADANGVINITVPIEKNEMRGHTTWADILISGHGGWWKVALTALKSAYGRTPFFEYYLDDFEPFFTSEWVGRSVSDYDEQLDRLLRRLLQIPTPVGYARQPDEEYVRLLSPDTRPEPFEPYYQVRSHRQGFIPNLSVVDLLFNLGPEAPLMLL